MNHFLKIFWIFYSAINISLFSVYLASILIVPVITIIVEYLITNNPSFRTTLQINLQDFHIYRLFTSSFVHANFSHFLGNVTSYLLIIIYGLILATVLKRNRLYFTLTKVIVLTFLIFGACFTFFNLTTTYYAGLSGINAALTGLLILFWLMFLGQKSGKSLYSYHGLAVVLVLALSVGIIVRYLILYHTPKVSALELWLVVMVGLLILAIGMYRSQFVDLYYTLRGLSGPSDFSPWLLLSSLHILPGTSFRRTSQILQGS